VPFVTIFAVPLVFVLIFLDPPQVLFVIFLVYSLSGPAVLALRLVKRPREQAPEKSNRT
jgi:CDP-diacylglycerol--serine O-phosphatidyltransferase